MLVKSLLTRKRALALLLLVLGVWALLRRGSGPVAAPVVAPSPAGAAAEDPRTASGAPTPGPTPGPTSRPATSPAAGLVDSAPSDGALAPPTPAHTIKGNADSMLFHTPDSPYYGRTVAEQWFDTEDAARAAGFVRWDERRAKTAGAKAAEPPVPPVPEGSFGPGSAEPLPGGESPGAAYTVKGNVDSMRFHTPESRTYRATIAEQWFDSEESARAAGFRRWDE